MAGTYKADTFIEDNSHGRLSRSPSPTLIYPLPKRRTEENYSDHAVGDSADSKDCASPFPFDPVDNVLDRSQNSLGAFSSILHRNLSQSPEDKRTRPRRRRSSKETTAADVSKHSTPGKSPKSPMVTDIDQAMAQMDERKLKAILVDVRAVGSSGNPMSSTPQGRFFHEGSDVEETNIDDEPPSAKMIASLKQKSLEMELLEDTPKSASSTGSNRRRKLSKECFIPSLSFDEAVKWPLALPNELDRRKCDSFDGETLLNWLSSEFDESHHLHVILSRHDFRILVAQFCTHLLSAGVLSEVDRRHKESIFKTHNQYKWTGQDLTHGPTPAELNPAPAHLWPPSSSVAGQDGEVVDWNSRLRYSEHAEINELLTPVTTWETGHAQKPPLSQQGPGRLPASNAMRGKTPASTPPATPPPTPFGTPDASPVAQLSKISVQWDQFSSLDDVYPVLQRKLTASFTDARDDMSTGTFVDDEDTQKIFVDDEDAQKIFVSRAVGTDDLFIDTGLRTSTADASVQCPCHQFLLLSPQVVLPSPQVALPSTQGVLPSPQVALPSTQGVLPSPQVALPSSQGVLPSPQVALPSTQVVLPSPQVALPSTQGVLPSPQVALPSSQGVLPSPQVALPSSQGVLPSPQVALPTSQGILTSPHVAPTSSIIAPTCPLEFTSPNAALTLPHMPLMSTNETLSSSNVCLATSHSQTEVSKNSLQEYIPLDHTPLIDPTYDPTSAADTNLDLTLLYHTPPDHTPFDDSILDQTSVGAAHLLEDSLANPWPVRSNSVALVTVAVQTSNLDFHSGQGGFLSPGKARKLPAQPSSRSPSKSPTLARLSQFFKSDKTKLAAEKRESDAQLKKEFEEEKEQLKRSHEEEMGRIREGYVSQIERLSQQILALQEEVRKSKTLAGIDKMTQEALQAAVAASKEAGFEQQNGPSDLLIAITGTPSQGRSRSHHDISQTESNLSTFSMSQDSLSTETPPPVPPPPASGVPCVPPPPPCPPPPPHAVGGPPPPPPPPPFSTGGPPPPPPPPGGPGLAQRKDSSKPIINPKSPMKPLFWKRIQVQAVKQKKENTEEKQLFWEEIQEEPINVDYFEELFAKVPVESKKKTNTNRNKPKAIQAAKVVPPKRSQAVGILLSSLRMEFSDIEEAILNLDTSVLDVEKFRAIYDNRPDEEEMKLIRKQLEKQPDVPLDKPEQFLYDLEQIPFVSDRIFCFIFQSSFQESMTSIDNKLNNLKMTCESLSTFVGVKRIFGLILACGNYMNGGSRTRGQADGFDLEILPKLKDVKGKDNRTSLLQFVVMRYVTRYDADVMGTDRAKLPLPDPSDIQQAGLVNFEDMEKELKKIHKDFDSAESKANTIFLSSNSDSLEPFKTVMTGFFHKGKQDLKEQEENLEDCKKLFDKTCTFFYVKPKHNEKVVTPEHFFSLWLSFCSDFKDIWKKEQQNIMKVRIKEAEERIRTIKESKSVLPATRAKKIGGLKDRLSRQGKI